MSHLARARAIVCYSDGCPQHEPPEDDCIECARAFWGQRLSADLSQGGGGGSGTAASPATGQARLAPGS